MPVTLKDIASAVGVSRQVVATVLTGKGSARASGATRDRILHTARLMGYRPHGPARSLATGKTRAIELQAHTRGQGLYHVPRHHMPLWAAAARFCQEREYSLILASRQEDQQEIPVRNLYERNVDGVALLGVSSFGTLEVAREVGIPAVCINPEMPRARLAAAGYDVFDFDNAGGIRAALTYLLELGHRQVGFVRGRSDNDDFEERWLAYLGAMHEMGLPVNPEWVWIGAPSVQAGEQIGARILHLESRPTSVLASCDNLALGVLRSVEAGGLRVPADLSVMGFDDVEAAAVVYPGLTTVRLDWFALGACGLERLFERLAAADQPEPQLVRYPVQVVVRESCQAARAISARV